MDDKHVEIPEPEPEDVPQILESFRKITHKHCDEHGDRMGPEDVVAEAEKPTSVLHKYFEWDDGEAGHRYRLQQAQLLMRRVKITIEREDPETLVVRTVRVRAVQSVPKLREPGGRSYVMADRVIERPDFKKSLLNDVVAQLIALRKRFNEIKELDAVWEAIDDLPDDFSG